MSAADRPAGTAPFDLREAAGEGPLWGLASADLNATLLAWPPGAGVVEHVNAERDVLVIVIGGSGVVTVDGERQPVHASHALLIEKGRRRAVEAGADGLRYVSIHLRRGGLQIEPLRGPGSGGLSSPGDATQGAAGTASAAAPRPPSA